ncbi:MAG TPA: 4-hydroxy-tetrahydrodipicolinate synthase [Peptococcaceae bacterium]|nr:4-hydroxy-tetrahydrodipicolinate synthase [Peptococcaceae bacterium]
MKKVPFTGSCVALITPFTENGVDFKKLEELIEWHIKEGTDAILICGTTGEASTMPDEEHREVLRFAVGKINKRVHVMAGAGSNDTRHAIELSQYCEEIGVDSILSVTPYYNKTTQEGLYQHFKAVASETGLPVILYNVPGRTAMNMLPETVARLAEIENVVAVKEASGSLNQVADIKRNTPDDFLVYSGDDFLTLPMLSVGGYGVISVAAHVAGDMIREMLTFFVTGKVKAARELHLKLFPLYKVLFITTNPVPVKAAVELIGINVGAPRLPLVRATEEEVEAIKEEMDKLGLLPQN